MRMLAAGIDVGTQGVRMIVADDAGNIMAQAERIFPLAPTARSQAAGRMEQDPGEWWNGVRACVAEALAAIRMKGFTAADIVAMSISSTSGTVIGVTEQGELRTPAIMYNDTRTSAEAAMCNQALENLAGRMGYRFSTSFGLPKIVWLSRHVKDLPRCRYVHAADFIVGRLTGRYDVTDEANALKSGYDLLRGEWPPELERDLGLDITQLPRVVSSGTPIDHVSNRVASELGLSARTIVVAGMTDGVASQIAAGAVKLGDWNSTLGTTLVIKGVTQELVVDRQRLLYSHRHPMGWWILGGASNTGGEAIERRFGRAQLAELDEQVATVTPSGVVLYPLERRGERFPFMAPLAERFRLGTAANDVADYAAHLEGVAYVERFSYDVIRELGVARPDIILASGGGAKSRVWLQIRADVLQRTFVPAFRGDGAMGSAINAAATSVFGDLLEAVAHMVTYGNPVEPRRGMAARYDEVYGRFVEELEKRGYVQ